MKIEGLKILHNVKTLWVSILAPSKCVFLRYKLLVVKMNENNMWNSLTKTNYELFCECDIVLGLTRILPMLELVQNLSKMPRVGKLLYVTL
jgi:hypothetical protein